jgi:hypothetical protein
MNWEQEGTLPDIDGRSVEEYLKCIIPAVVPDARYEQMLRDPLGVSCLIEADGKRQVFRMQSQEQSGIERFREAVFLKYLNTAGVNGIPKLHGWWRKSAPWVANQKKEWIGLVREYVEGIPLSQMPYDPNLEPDIDDLAMHMLEKGITMPVCHLRGEGCMPASPEHSAAIAAPLLDDIVVAADGKPYLIDVSMCARTATFNDLAKQHGIPPPTQPISYFRAADANERYLVALSVQWWAATKGNG